MNRLLIANRGEIACRIVATAGRLGIATVAVYSDAEPTARHVAMADEAIRLGPPKPADSYLNTDAILDAASRSGADAIHPGYGFLSENPDFVAAVEAAGLTFVGPPATAIRAMGLKDAAKALMERAGVPVVPGYHGADQDTATLKAEAERIGYPVLIKARAGGGGKGMRLVERAGDFEAALESAQREGEASFSDPRVLIERFVTSPRHVEIQVFADTHGNTIHLFERDCSLQRRHQKVIEEAPAPGMTDAMRSAMGKAAVETARAVGYVGAGTVEFIADASEGLRPDRFFFMEMNTRLQVEHPVSEAVTGVDLVEWQLRVAAGEPLPLAQSDLAIEGHAFEARLYAEDVPSGFLPATGRLEHLAFPQGTAFAPGPVRIDAGVGPGDTITPWYDPMVAKIIVHGPDRPTALRLLRRALAETEIAGTVTNRDFLAALAAHDGFVRGAVDTGLIGRDLAALTQPPARPDHLDAAAALLLAGLADPPATDDPWDVLRGHRNFGAARLHLTIADPTGAPITIILTHRGDDAWQRGDVGAGATLRLAAQPDSSHTLEVAGHRTRLRAARHGTAVTLFVSGNAVTYRAVDPIAANEAAAGGNEIAAPMPGIVTNVAAAPGDTVAEGAALIILEAMKMEHTLRAPRDGTLAEVAVAPGDQVSQGAVLATLQPDG